MPHATFIHGIADEPPQNRWPDLWHRSLAGSYGLNLGTEGVTSSTAALPPAPPAQGEP